MPSGEVRTRPPHSRRDAVDIRNDGTWVLAFALLFVAAIGVVNGDINHPVYLLAGLHRADPGFLAADWFVSETAYSHLAFAYVVEAIARTGALEFGLAVAAVLQSATVALGAWLLARRLYDDPVLPWAMTLLMLAATHTRGVGLTWLLMPQLEAATIATAMTVLGLALLGAARPGLPAGLAFGVAALMHANYAVLLTPVVGAAAAVMVVRRERGRALAILLPFLALAAPVYVQVAHYAGAPHQAEAGRIILARYAHHFDPSTWGPAQGLLFAAVLLAGGTAFCLRRPRDRPALFAAVGAMVLVAVGSLIIGYADLSDSVKHLFGWRLSTILIFLAVLLTAAAATRPPVLSEPGTKLVTAGFALVALGALAGLAVGDAARRVGLASLVFLLVAWRSGWLANRGGPRRQDGGGGADQSVVSRFAVFLAFLPFAWSGLAASHVDFRAESEQRAVIYDWILNHTPEEARFAVPPGWSDFRLLAKRAIIIHKSPPVEPTDVMEWVDRLEAVTGLPPLAESAPLDSAFLASDCGRIAALTDRYGIGYAIRSTDSPPCGHVVFSEGDLAVVALEAGAPAPGTAPAP